MADEERLTPPAELGLSIGEAMFTQRAIRRFTRDPVSDADLKLILDAVVEGRRAGATSSPPASW